jgi:hypothetical protein
MNNQNVKLLAEAFGKRIAARMFQTSGGRELLLTDKHLGDVIAVACEQFTNMLAEIKPHELPVPPQPPQVLSGCAVRAAIQQDSPRVEADRNVNDLLDAIATRPRSPAQAEAERSLTDKLARYYYLRECATRVEVLHALELQPDEWDAYIDARIGDMQK